MFLCIDLIRALLKRFNLSKDDIDLYEINEAFGSMYAYCVEKLGLDIEKVNVNGGAMYVSHIPSLLLKRICQNTDAMRLIWTLGYIVHWDIHWDVQASDRSSRAYMS